MSMTVSAKMTAIANEIRTLSDTTSPLGLDAMASRVGEANEEVASQEDLIADIIAALECKTANECCAEFVQTNFTSRNIVRGALCYGNGVFILVQATAAYYSTDGINWTETALPIQALWASACYGNGVFLVAGAREYLISTDGINWTANDEVWYSDMAMCYGGGKFIACFKQNYSGLGYSTDGVNWEYVTGVTNQTSAVCHGGGKYVQVGRWTLDDSGTSHPTAIAGCSTDGINWTETTLPSAQDWSAACYGKGTFVALANNSNKGAYSTDGINWAEMELPSSQEWVSVCYGNGMFITIANNTDAAAYSMDGINWTAFTMPSSGTWFNICYGEGKFVAAGQNMPVAVCDVTKPLK